MTNHKPSVQASVLAKIRQEAMQPTPAWHFMAKECVVVLLWLGSVLIGAIAIAVTIYAINYQRFAFFEATHDSWRRLLLESLPWLWLLVLIAGLVLASYYQKHFRRGYRYPLWALLVIGASSSVFVGIGLHAYGMGFIVDTMAAKYMPMYNSQASREARLWQDPMNGRLLGMQVYTTTAPTSTIIFADQNNVRWRTDISELSEEDMQLLRSGQRVRLLGLLNNELVHSFHACGAFPWMADKPMPNETLAAERAAFVRRVYRHDPANGSQAGQIVLETIVATDTIAIATGRCRQLPAVIRMHRTHN